MFSTPQLQPAKPFERLSVNRWLAVSVTLHVLVLGLFFYHRQPTLKATQLPGNLNGSRLLLTYDPGVGSKSIASLHGPRGSSAETTKFPRPPMSVVIM